MAAKFKIKIDEDAVNDIQQTTDWYNEQIKGLGTRFQNQVKSQINSLKTKHDVHALRYADVHCMLIKKFPFMIHYTVDKVDEVVEIFAIIHTSRNPKIWELRRKL